MGIFSRCMKRGSLLLEAMVAIGIFAIFLGGIGLTLMVGERTTIVGGDRANATFVAEKALEGLRAMSRKNFESITAGYHGIWLDPNGIWAYSGSQVNVNNGYISQVAITPVDSTEIPACTLTDCFKAESTVRWDFGQTRSGSLVLTTYLTNWRQIANLGNWATMTRESKTSFGGLSGFRSVAVSGNYAFIGANSTLISYEQHRWFAHVSSFFQSIGLISPAHAQYTGPGLVIVDIAVTPPVRVADTFTLGGLEVYDIAVDGTRLYILTSDAAQELYIYDIADLPGSDPLWLGGYDIAGSGLARSLAYFRNNTFVGDAGTLAGSRFASILSVYDGIPSAHAQSGSNGTTVLVGTDDGDNTLYAILVRDDATTDLLDSLDVNGGVNDIRLKDAYAYLSTRYNVGELEVVDVFDPTNIVFAPGTGRDENDVMDGLAMEVTGTSAILTRLRSDNANVYELTLYNIETTPVPVASLAAVDMAGDPWSISSTVDSRYAFVASNADASQIRVINLGKFSAMAGDPSIDPVDKVYNSGEPMAGIFYDPQTNKLFSVSDDDLYIFIPG